MQAQNFNISFLVEQTPNEVYNAINNVRGWCSETLEGNSEKMKKTKVGRMIFFMVRV